MNEYTVRLARDCGVSDRVRTLLVDVHELPFEDASFDVVIALGVLPWLHTPGRALTEMARVLRPGGDLLITVDNVFRLADWLDPGRNPVLPTMRGWMGDGLRRSGIRRSPKAVPLTRRNAPGTVDAALASRGLSKVRSTTIGFGPLTFWYRPIVSERASARMHRTLQRLSDRGVPVIRDVGAHYVVLAQKIDDN
jgi:SAM-dependent methyltransferase